MTWLHRYQLKRSSRSSLWLLPVLAIGLVLVVAPFLRWLDRQTGWSWFNFTPDGARAVLGAFTSSMLTLVVFVVSSLLIVVQLASAQLTPRIIATAFANRRLQWVLGIFTFAYAYTIAASGRIEDTTPQLPVAFAIFCNLLCIAIFFWFGQWLGFSLRPIAVLQGVADEGRAVVESVYPEPFDPAEEQPGWSPAPEAEVVVVEHTGSSGVVLAFSQRDLTMIAGHADVVLELVPQVGDFVARGDPLFHVRTGGRPVDACALRACVAIGPERTMEQDPRFAFRIMVDIANKALSPAINDPTTAVLALDQIHRLLMYVGQRRLDAGAARDAQGRLRLCYGTPDWIDFVSLGITEIRLFGGSSMQVARRLQAMIEHLLRVLPEARKAALEQELSLLQRAIQRIFPDEEDRACAQVGDLQGLGSSE
ncbi:MAG TPA: DUF2254 domain-containing protein [Gemmataceae bacterium]|nr:DUF2254 domain-containing protein [Gemmataceae bacterium]